MGRTFNNVSWYCLGVVLLFVMPAVAHADWTAADDEANRQRMMADMRTSQTNYEIHSENSLANQQNAYNENYGSGSAGPGGGGSSGSGYSYQPYSYIPEGPQGVSATYEFTISVKESVPEVIARLSAETDAGNAQSSYDLGRIYYTGYGADVDLGKAHDAFCRAAALGHPPAAAQCGVMLLHGQGGPADDARARTYIDFAAGKGEPFGLTLKGFLTISEAADIDAPQPDAVAMLVRAADRGQPIAQFTLGSTVLFYGTSGEHQDITRAVAYVQMAAAQDFPPALAMLGQLYLQGLPDGGIAQDQQKGVALMVAAADKGNAQAAGMCAVFAKNGDLLPHDDARAFRWATESAQGGDAFGELVLGEFYYFGTGTDKDVAKAAHWFKAAADQGQQQAKKNLMAPDIAAALSTAS